MDWTFFLACIISVSAFVAGQTPKYVFRGTGEQLKPDICGQPSSILWKHNGYRVVEFDGSAQQVFGSYENRITLDWITAELEITDLRIEDSGDYEFEVFINNDLHTDEYQLEVIDKVAKPTISCEISKGSSLNESEGQATLLCSAEPVQPESLMMVEWRSQGRSYPKDEITFSLKDQKDDEQYTCVVSNPLSSETATCTVKECYHEEESSSATTVALSILALLGVVGTALGILFCKFKQKACFANDEEKQAPTEESENRASQKRALLPKVPDKNETLPSTQRLRQNNSTDDNSGSDSRKQGSVLKKVKQIEQFKTQNEAIIGPASAPPVLDRRSIPFDHPKNDEGGQAYMQNTSLQEKAINEETFPTTTDETSHLTEASSDISAHTANADNKEPERTAGTTTRPDISLRQRSSSVPEEEGSDRSALKKDSHPPKDEDNTEETNQQNQERQGSVLKKVKQIEQFKTLNEAIIGPASAPPVLDRRSIPFDHPKNDEGGQAYMQNTSLQEKAINEETFPTTTDETSHLTEASSDISAHTANADNKEPERTAGTTTRPDISLRQRSSSVPEEEGSDRSALKKDSHPPKDEDNTEETNQQNQERQGSVLKKVKQIEQFKTLNEAIIGPASAPPVLDRRSKPFDHPKNDEGGQADMQNTSLQEKAINEETFPTTTDETSHLTEASSDISAHTANADNKEPERTAGTTTRPDISLRQRSSSVPEEEGSDRSALKKDSHPPKDEDNTEETNQQNQEQQGSVLKKVKQIEQFKTLNEAIIGPASAPPVLDRRSKPFDHPKNDEGGQADMQNTSLQEKAINEETFPTTTDETSHLTEASSDISAHTANADNKEPERTAGTTTRPDISLRQRSSSVPEEEGSDRSALKKDSHPPKDEDNTEETNQQNQEQQGSVLKKVKQIEQFKTLNEAIIGPASAPPVLDRRSKPFDHPKNDEGGQADMQNTSLQEKAINEETFPTTTDETSHLTEASSDISAHTANADNKEPERTAGTTTRPDISLRQRSSSVPEEEGSDRSALKKDSHPPKDEDNTEETNQQNQEQQGSVLKKVKQIEQFKTLNEAIIGPASAPPVLDRRSKPFDHPKNDEGGQADMQNTSLQEKAINEETFPTTTDETSHLTEASSDISAHTANADNKEPERTAGTTTRPDISLRQRSSSVPEEEGSDRSALKKDSHPPKDEDNTEETNQQNQEQLGSVLKKVKQIEQFKTQNEAIIGPASAPPVLDRRSKPFDHPKNDEGGQADMQNTSLQEKAINEETFPTTTDETSHLTEASSDISAHTANADNKEPERTAGTTTRPDISLRQRSSSVPKEEGSDRSALKKDSHPPKDEDNTEETNQQNQEQQGSVLKKVKQIEQFKTLNEAIIGTASAPPVLDRRSIPFDHPKNDEGGQPDMQNTSLQEKAPSEETPATTTDETAHLTEASSDIPAHTENEDNKEPEITEETAGTTTGPDSSSEQRSSTLPEQEDTDTTPFKKDSDSSKDGEHT